MTLPSVDAEQARRAGQGRPPGLPLLQRDARQHPRDAHRQWAARRRLSTSTTRLRLRRLRRRRPAAGRLRAHRHGADGRQAAAALERGEALALSDVQRRIVEQHALSTTLTIAACSDADLRWSVRWAAGRLRRRPPLPHRRAASYCWAPPSRRRDRRLVQRRPAGVPVGEVVDARAVGQAGQREVDTTGERCSSPSMIRRTLCSSRSMCTNDGRRRASPRHGISSCCRGPSDRRSSAVCLPCGACSPTPCPTWGRPPNTGASSSTCAGAPSSACAWASARYRCADFGDIGPLIVREAGRAAIGRDGRFRFVAGEPAQRVTITGVLRRRTHRITGTVECAARSRPDNAALPAVLRFVAER